MRNTKYLVAAMLTASSIGGLIGCKSGESQSSTPARKLAATEVGPQVATEMETLGALLFFDRNLSSSGTQSCASCHAPNRAFTDPNQGLPTSKGAVPDRFGGRNAPTIMYSKFSPKFGLAKNDEGELDWVGGLFWDGRAATLEEQAKGPFLNPLEMNNANASSVVAKVRISTYAERFKSVFGAQALEVGNEDLAFNQIAEAIAAFERTPAVNRFSSKYDAYLKGQTTLTAEEMRGLQLFNNKKTANCAACHTSQAGPNGEPPLFTDFSYDNLGVPRNPANPFYKLEKQFNPAGAQFKDIGLQATTKNVEQRGKVKVPTLRNIALTAPYMHNGYFQTLRGVIDYYNSRDTKPKCASPLTSEADAIAQNCWPVSEITTNVNHEELGNLKLSNQDIADIEAFLMTLTDGWQAQSPK